MCTTKAPDHADKKPKADHDKAPTDHEPAPEPKSACTEPPGLRAGVDGAPTSMNQGQNVDASPTTNPTYVDARFAISKYFARQAEIAALTGKAATDGFEAFKIRSSAEYNQSDSVVFAIFQAVLATLPVAAELANVLSRVGDGLKKAELIAASSKALLKMHGQLHETSEALERVAKIGEGFEHAQDAVEKSRNAKEIGAHGTEAHERGEFQMEALHSITQLSVESLQQRWRDEDFIETVIGPLQLAPPELNLVTIVQTALGSLPDPGTLQAALRHVADEFEIALYVKYYVDGRRLTYVTLDRDEQISHRYEGLPAAVMQRFQQLQKIELLADRDKVPAVNEHMRWQSQWQ